MDTRKERKKEEDGLMRNCTETLSRNSQNLRLAANHEQNRINSPQSNFIEFIHKDVQNNNITLETLTMIRSFYEMISRQTKSCTSTTSHKICGRKGEKVELAIRLTISKISFGAPVFPWPEPAQDLLVW